MVKDGDEMNIQTPDVNRFHPVLVARPGQLCEKSRKYDFGLVIREVEKFNGSWQPMYEVWVADTNETRRVFWSDLRKYTFKKPKK